MLILVLLFAAKCLVSAEYYRWENTSYNRVYRQYMEEIGGEYSAEKADYVQREYDISRALVNRREEMEQAYIAREIDKETFEAYLTEYNTAQAKIPVLQDLMERSAYLEGLLSQKGIRASYVFDEGLERYIYQGTDWLLVLFICIFCCRAVLVEFGKTSSKGPIFQLVQSTSRGRLSLYLKKTLLCLLVSAFVYWLFAAADLFFWLRNWEILSTGDLLISLPAYSQASAMWTLGGYGVFTLLSGVLGVFLMVFLCLNLALLLKDTIFVYSVQAVVWIVPYFMTSIGLVFCRYFDFTGLVDTKRIFYISYTVMRGGAGELGFFIFFFVIAVLLTAALSSLSVRQIRRGFVG